jgi:hypothetical protein
MADITNAQIDAAIARGKLALAAEPRAASARYDREGYGDTCNNPQIKSGLR